MKIACNSLLFYRGNVNTILAINSSKGKGYTLPGGKYEESDECFYYAAARELEEETGLVADMQKLIWHGMNPRGVYLYTFFTVPKSWDYRESKEGKPCVVNWRHLLEDSAYAATNRILFDTLKEKGILA